MNFFLLAFLNYIYCNLPVKYRLRGPVESNDENIPKIVEFASFFVDNKPSLFRAVSTYYFVQFCRI